MNISMSAGLKYQRGFTLVELLVALVLLGIVLSAVVYVNIGTIRSSASLQSRNELLSEMQIAQNYMASKLRQAAYVFPIGDNIQMSASGATTATLAGGSNWVIGTGPIVAFIIPPKTVGTTATTNCASGTAIEDRCYAFYAFYAMTRQAYLNATSGANRPAEDAANTGSWVLVEYRGYYSSAALNVNQGYQTFPNSIPQSNQGRLLMDYLLPTTGTESLFTSPPNSTQAVGTTSVNINLATQRNVAGQIVRLPATSRNLVTVYPRNVGKPQLNN